MTSENRKRTQSFDELLAPIRSAAREDLPALCGALAAVQAELLMMPVLKPERRDRALSPLEVAQLLGRSQDWVYRHRHSLPITPLPSGRWVVMESRFLKWMEARARR
jgi:hypothetical protein